MITFTITILLFIASANAQESLTNEFETMPVNKKVGDYPDKYDMSTPLNAFVSYMYLSINGKNSMRKKSTSERMRASMPAEDTPDSQVPEAQKQMLMNLPIDEIIVYRDSVAGVISKFNESTYLVRVFSREDGKWLNAGENAAQGLEGARSMFASMAPEYTGYIRAISQPNIVSSDTLAFVNYVKKNGKDPKAFILNKLANHKLYIYGELHKRKASWDLLKSVINDPSFPQHTGIVFLEMSSDSQEKLDKFFAGKTMDKEILLDILRSVQIEGWDDRGMYEFVQDLWKINQKLPEKNKIKVTLTDIPRPFGSMKNNQEFNDYFRTKVIDRNQQMADIIEAGLKASADGRGGLFIVGAGHAFKAKVAMGGGASAPEGQKPKLSAGAQLKERFSDKDVYISFVHSAIVSNSGNVEGLTRNGIFDYAFASAGNKPVAFDLAGSPFGKERFDAFIELKYVDGIGKYENNYDGYIFLMPLKDEGPKYLLTELFTEDFVKELHRRAAIMGYDDWWEHGGRVKDITLEDIRKHHQKEAQGKYWNGLSAD